MGKNTNISWCDSTANFWHGCFKVSPGCKNCYAETLSKRWGRDIWGPPLTSNRQRTKQPWKDILDWNAEAWKAGERKKVFVMSMGDFFEDHPQVTEWRDEACKMLPKLRWLDIQILTKRPENIAHMVPDWWMLDWPKNIWIGTSVENQEMADKRIPELLKVPAAIRFLSIEPMLEKICLTDVREKIPRGEWSIDALRDSEPLFIDDLVHRNKVHWCIVGGESGANHRPLEIEWIADIVSQCRAANVPVFVKQDSGLYPGRQGRIPDELFIQEFPA